MTDESKNTTGLGLFAAGVVFLAFPLGVAALFIATGGPEGIAAGFMEAGWFAYLIVAATFITCVASAIVLFLAARKNVAPALALIPVVALSAVAVVGMGLGRAQVLDALAMVSPADRLTILAGGIGETMNIEIIALAFTAAVLLMVGIGALIMLAAGQRTSSLLAAGGAVALAVMSALFLQFWSSIAGGFRAIANAEPTQRARLLTLIIDEAGASHRIGLAFLAVVVLLGIASIALLVKRNRGHATSTAIALIITGVGIAGLHARAKHQVFAIPDSAVLFPEARRTLDGSPRQAQSVVMAMDDGFDSDPVARRIDARLEKGGALGLRLSDETKADDLRDALRAARLHRARVQLLAAGRRGAMSEAIPENCDFCRAFASTETAVPITVHFPGEKCAACVPMGPNWAHADAPEEVTWDKEGAAFDWRTGSVEDLLEAATLAWHNGYVLSVVVSSAEGEDDEDDEE